MNMVLLEAEATTPFLNWSYDTLTSTTANTVNKQNNSISVSIRVEQHNKNIIINTIIIILINTYYRATPL